MRILRLPTIVGLLAAAALVAPSQATAQVQFFNGDTDGVNGIANESNSTSGIDGMMFETFSIGPAGMALTGIFGHFFAQGVLVPNWSSALWEVRSGITAGNGGTLLLSGSSAASRTFVGVFGARNRNVYEAMVSGINLFLPSGEYWFGLSPIRTENFQIYLATTSGANGVNANIDQSNYFNSSYFGRNFSPNIIDGANFSLGVTGRLGEASTVPEPATLTLLASGLVALGTARRKQRSA